jgi:histidinol-phosphate aminotransferase
MARGWSRREFAKSIGTGFGAVLLHSPLGSKSAPAALRPGRGTGAIQLDSNENPYGPSQKAIEAMTRSQPVASRYPDAREDEVIEVIAKLHNVKPEQIALGCGSGEILRVADMAFTTPGSRLVTAEPTFEAVLHYCKIKGAESVKVPLTPDFRLDLDGMAGQVGDTTHMVYVCNPNNPTGTIVSGADLKRFVSRVPKGTIVLLDEAYHHFVEDPSYQTGAPWVAEYPNLIVVRTFSKVFGLAGMRLGYSVSSAENAEAMRPHLTFSNANAAVLDAALACLSDEPHVVSERNRNSETRRTLVETLRKEGWKTLPSQTNFVMIYLGRDVATVIPEFRKREILVGRKFPSMGEWLRVSMGTPPEMATFLRAFHEILPKAPA